MNKEREHARVTNEQRNNKTNLEKVAAVRIGKAVCKANDMMLLYKGFLCVDMRKAVAV